jgi:hypothetical protein
MKPYDEPENSGQNAGAACGDDAHSAGAARGAPARRRSLTRSAANFWVDVLAFLTFLASTVSGLVLLQSPDAARYGAEPLGSELLLGLTRFEWEHLHNHISIIFVLLVLVHMALHRRWIARSFAGSSIPDNNSK